MKKLAVAAFAALAALSLPALAEGDAAKGEKVFNKCKACHDVDKGINKVGPTLKGVVGRKIASVEEAGGGGGRRRLAEAQALTGRARTDPRPGPPLRGAGAVLFRGHDHDGRKQRSFRCL